MNIYTFFFFIYICLFIFIAFSVIDNKDLNNRFSIYIANSFFKWSTNFNCGIYKCKNSLTCFITKNYSTDVNLELYNAWTKITFLNNSNFKRRILWSREKISWRKEMINIGLGIDKKFYGGIDYRLFYSPNHFSQSYLGSINVTLKEFINNAKKNVKNINTFMRRKSIVYIQRKDYPKRTELVKRLMTYFVIDSYGINLNNKYWDRKISKVDIIKKYKFCLAIENSIQTSTSSEYYSDDIDTDYSTEKLYDCLEAGAIPIYYGPKNSYIFLPNNNSAIVMGKFNNINKLVSYIKEIEHSKYELSKYISWTFTYSKSWYNRFSNIYKYSICKLCEWGYENNN